MISPELSTIQRNKERSAALEAEVAAFLKRGGVIETKKGFPSKPKPKQYGRMTPPPVARLHLSTEPRELSAQRRRKTLLKTGATPAPGRWKSSASLPRQ
ncbi:Prophage PssSM-03, Orf48 [Pseudomonas syringae pv. syringae str. B301D-R]|nr:hypothetical protein PsyrB_14490 [Pseudomonas syringae pv. syringae B301D]EXL28675.1 Prophage PssSM-03, Orf48 [Pseudomonas syringae pv. syringae str. B301D-R]